MAKRRIYYLLLLAAGGYFIMLYDYQGLRFLFCSAVIIPIASLMLLIPEMFLCKVDISEHEGCNQFKAVSRGEELKFNVLIKKRGFLPVSKVHVCVCWRAPGEKEIKLDKWLYGVKRRKTGEEISMEFTSSHCGLAELIVEKIRICDYLGLFSLPVGRRKKAQICIMPIIEAVSMCEMQLNVLRGEKDGDMILRDFQPGDSMHSVYWKLSAKTDELQVRDFEQNGMAALFLDFSPDFRKNAEEWDRYLDRACSILYFLIEAGEALNTYPEVIWREENFFSCTFQGTEDLQVWIHALLMQRGAGVPLREDEIPFPGECCHLKEDCRLYLGEQCVYE